MPAFGAGGQGSSPCGSTIWAGWGPVSPTLCKSAVICEGANPSRLTNRIVAQGQCTRLIHGRRRFKSFRSDHPSVAQPAERRAYTAEVAGSLPAAGTTSICGVEVCAPARKPGGAGAIPAGWTTEEQADWRRHPARTRASASLGRSTRPSSATPLARRRPPRRPRRTGREAHTLHASRPPGHS